MKNRSDFFAGVGQIEGRSPDALHRPGIGDNPPFEPVAWVLILIGALVVLRWLWERAAPA